MGARNFKHLTSPDAVRALATKLLAEGKPIGFDVETGYNGPDREKGSLYIDWDEQFVCGFSITNDLNWAVYVPVAHDDTTVNVPDAWEIIQPVVETLPTTAHNMRFEARNLRALERKGRGPRIDINIGADSALQSYVLSEYQYHGLKALSESVFGYEQAEIESLFPGMTEKQKKAVRFNVLELTPEVVNYACDDAVQCLALDRYFMPKIEAHQHRSRIYQIEMEILKILCDMEDAGHAVDWDALIEAGTYASPFMEFMTVGARNALQDMAGEGYDYSTLNFNSAPQMRRVLYEDLGLHTTRKTDKGELSTDATALEKLAKEIPAVKKVLEVREVKNLEGRLKKWENEYSISYDKRVHASFNQVVVPSGRFSANDPAIQQLPKEWRWTSLVKKGLDVWNKEHWAALKEKTIFGRHYWGGNFRDFLVSEKGRYLLVFDWSQIELRILAGLSQEPALIEAFAQGKDIHTATAAQMLHLAYENVTDKDRAKGKAQPLTATVWTSDGPRKMGEIEVGDAVLTPDGVGAKVTGVFPQGDRPVYRVIFADGSSTECDEEHLWTVRHNKRKWTKTLTLKELMESGVRIGGEDLKWSVPEVAPQEFPKRDLPLDPYALGLLLGDGGMTTPGVYFTSSDDELATGLAEALPENVSLTRIYTRVPGDGSTNFNATKPCHGYRLSTVGAVGKHSGSNRTIQSRLREAGVFGLSSHTKHIPENYKRGSVADRLALLQGLVDTDGWITRWGSVGFTSASRQLVEDIREVVLSLGGQCGLVAELTSSWTYKGVKKYGKKYKITFNLPMCPARLKRKAERWQPPRHTARSIKEIEYVGERPVQCIMVDHPDHLYLTDDFIPTHNTINFGLVYQMGVDLLADSLGIEVWEAEELFASYFAAFTQVGDWFNQAKNYGTSLGYTETYFGRKVTIWELQSDYFSVRSKGERLCVNAPCQGTAADYAKISMVRCANALKQKGWWQTKVRMINNLHDALTFEADNDIDPNELRELLMPCVTWEIPNVNMSFWKGKDFPPMKVDWEIGKKWGSLQKWKDHQRAVFMETPGDPEWIVVENDDTPDLTVDNPEPVEQSIPTAPLVVSVQAMPKRDQMVSFVGLLKENPGPSPVVFQTPEGSTTLNITTSLSPASQAHVSMLLGGAQVHYKPEIEELKVEL